MDDVKYITIDNYIETQFGNVKAYVFVAQIKYILPIYYVAVRGRDDVEGAVQRVLNKRRINSIKEYILKGNMFFGSFILNWMDSNWKIQKSDDCISIPEIPSAAQVIDGQHRLEGIKRAVSEDESIEDKSILIVMTENMTTEEAAKVFLNINTEQKPVPMSLVYDLFGVIEDNTTPITRGTDIANELHTDMKSPFYQCIKMPGAPHGVGKIDLSTVVNSLKNYFTEDSVFDIYNISDYRSEYRILFNYFNAIKHFYDEDGSWIKNKNPFMTNAGFYAAVKFLCEDLISECVKQKSFEETTFVDLLSLDSIGLMYRDDLKNIQGKEQRNRIYSYLKRSLSLEAPKLDEYKF